MSTGSSSNVVIKVEEDVAGVVERLTSLIEKSANEAIATNDIFKIGLSGINFHLSCILHFNKTIIFIYNNYCLQVVH